VEPSRATPEPPDAADVLEATGSGFHTSMVHLYRGEMHRMTVWRSRLDNTTHWAIILTTGLTTFVLGAVQIPHYVMLLGLAFNTILMWIEGRRYQHLHHSKWRLHLLEHNFFGAQLARKRKVDTRWRQILANDLEQPVFPITRSLAVRVRLRRNYLMLVYFTTAVWLTKVFIHPASPVDAVDWYGRLALGDLLPSWFVALSAGAFLSAVTVLAVTTPSEAAIEERFVRPTPRGQLGVRRGVGVPRETGHPSCPDRDR
jgi:uncharacterized membrane protein